MAEGRVGRGARRIKQGEGSGRKLVPIVSLLSDSGYKNLTNTSQSFCLCFRAFKIQLEDLPDFFTQRHSFLHIPDKINKIKAITALTEHS